MSVIPPLKMYSKSVLQMKWILFSHIVKWVGKWPVTDHYYISELYVWLYSYWNERRIDFMVIIHGISNYCNPLKSNLHLGTTPPILLLWEYSFILKCSWIIHITACAKSTIYYKSHIMCTRNIATTCENINILSPYLLIRKQCNISMARILHSNAYSFIS